MDEISQHRYYQTSSLSCLTSRIYAYKNTKEKWCDNNDRKITTLGG
jgi:hypothetical protein